MNVLLWVLQILLAVHTAIGAVWKFSNTVEKTAPSLAAIPQHIWLSMSVFELICAAGLIIPFFNKSLAILIPIAAIGIALEMLAMCGIHLSSGDTNHAPMIYWLVVAALCVFTAYGRYALKPLE